MNGGSVVRIALWAGPLSRVLKCHGDITVVTKRWDNFPNTWLLSLRTFFTQKSVKCASDVTVTFNRQELRQFLVIYFYRPQICEGCVFTRVCHSVHRGGVPQGPYPGGGGWGVWPGGGSSGPGPGGGSRLRQGVGGGGHWGRPPSRRLLLRTVRILLECILVAPYVYNLSCIRMRRGRRQPCESGPKWR